MAFFTAWWESITLVQQIMACVAIPSTIILLLQTIMLVIGLAGGGSEGDLHADYEVDGDIEADLPDGSDIPDDMPEEAPNLEIDDGDDVIGHQSDNGLRVFTVRGLVAFGSVGGWMGIAAVDWGLHASLAVSIALASGTIALYLMAYIFKAAMMLQEDGTIELKNAISSTSTVYIPIQPSGKPGGKVNLYLQGRYVEIDAITELSEKIPTGEEVVVVGTYEDNTLVIKPKKYLRNNFKEDKE